MTAADPAVRRVYVVAIRSRCAAFLVPFLTAGAARRRCDSATRRGWRAEVVAADLVALDGASLDPHELPEPDPLADLPAPRRRRRRRRHGVDLDERNAP